MTDTRRVSGVVLGGWSKLPDSKISKDMKDVVLDLLDARARIAELEAELAALREPDVEFRELLSDLNTATTLAVTDPSTLRFAEVGEARARLTARYNAVVREQDEALSYVWGEMPQERVESYESEVLSGGDPGRRPTEQEWQADSQSGGE